MQTIPIIKLSLVFIPPVFLLILMFYWGIKGFVGVYANIRMVLQLILVGYLLTYIFEIRQPIIIILVIILMIAVSAWIAIRSLKERSSNQYSILQLRKKIKKCLFLLDIIII